MQLPSAVIKQLQKGQPPLRRHPRVRRSQWSQHAEGSAAHEHPRRKKGEIVEGVGLRRERLLQIPQSRTARPCPAACQRHASRAGSQPDWAKLCPEGLCFQAARQERGTWKHRSPGTPARLRPRIRHLQGSRATGKGGLSSGQSEHQDVSHPGATRSS